MNILYSSYRKIKFHFQSSIDKNLYLLSLYVPTFVFGIIGIYSN